MKNPVKNLASLLFTIAFLALTLSTVCAQTEKSDQASTISDGSKVSLEYTLTLEKEGVVDSNVGGEPLSFVYGSKQIIPGLEKGVLGLRTGDVKKLEIASADGYGPVYQEAITNAKLSQLPKQAQQVGAMVQTQGQDGQIFRGKVIGIEGENVTVDFNHPLAGKTLYFDIKILSVE